LKKAQKSHPTNCGGLKYFFGGAGLLWTRVVPHRIHNIHKGDLQTINCRKVFAISKTQYPEKVRATSFQCLWVDSIAVENFFDKQMLMKQNTNNQSTGITNLVFQEIFCGGKNGVSHEIVIVVWVRL